MAKKHTKKTVNTDSPSKSELKKVLAQVAEIKKISMDLVSKVERVLDAVE